MDIRINLLPPEMIARHSRWRRQRRLYLAGGAGLAVLLAAHAVLFVTTQLVNHNVNRLIKERQAIEGEVQAYRKFSEMRARVAEIEKLLQKARGTPVDVKRTLAEISLRIPLNVWLTEITVGGKEGGKSPAAGASAEGTAGGKGGQAGGALPESSQSRTKAVSAGKAMEVTIKGWAFGHSSVALWLEDLEKVYGLSDVQCQLSNSEKLGDNFMTRFEIKANLGPGPAGEAGGP
ncbi:MAG: hypothetical protein HPY89_01250 [Pelotomaculum sp.]|nr:hypothetical protein [Pelotomaculum sp.]